MAVYIADSASSEHWFAIQVYIGREQQAARQLEVRGYEVFLPSYIDVCRWSDRVKRIRRPLFSGYVFCRVSVEVMGKIVTAPTVIRIVGDGAGPIPVCPAEMTALQKVVSAGLDAEPWEYLEVGNTVRLIDGPLRDCEGVVLRIKGRDRVVIGVTLLRRAVAIEVNPSWIYLPATVRLDCIRRR